MWHKIALPVLLIAGFLLPYVCTVAQEEALKVVASHSILADVVHNIAGDRIELTTLIPVGADAHSFRPSPRDLTPLSVADVVFVNGARFEEVLLEAIEGAAGAVPIVEVSACIDIIPFGATADMHDDHASERGNDSGSRCDDHAAEHQMIIGEEEDHLHVSTLGRLEDIDCGGGHDANGHAHEADACDPHVWMDPHNVIFWALMLRDTLSALDPDNADAYAAGAASYIGDLFALEAEFILPLLAELPLEKRILVTTHDSLGYLATTFDFQVINTAIPGGATTVEPSAREIAALIDLIKDADVPAIFGETTISQTVMETIADETGAELVILYSDTLSIDGPATTYLDYIRYNFRTIVDALSVDA